MLERIGNMKLSIGVREEIDKTFDLIKNDIFSTSIIFMISAYIALSIPFSINSLGLNLSSTFQILFGVLGTAIIELLLFSASFYFLKNSFNISMNTYHKENNDVNHKIRNLFNVDMKLYYMCSALTFLLSLVALFYLYTSADIIKQQFSFENIKHKYTVFQCLIIIVSYYFFNEMNNKLQKKRLELMLTKSR